ncbi:MAG: hypothetical protein GX070_03165 [Alcaligenaceae bacterium]|nr:hypothetical protein [Alcaligenaceae bacterium]
MKKAFFLIPVLLVSGAAAFSANLAVAADFQYSPPLEVGFKTTNNDLKFRTFDQDKLEERSTRVTCAGPCDDRRTAMMFMQRQSFTSLPVLTETKQIISNVSVAQQSLSVSNESTNSDTAVNRE